MARPRNEEIDPAILATAARVLLTRGYSGLNIDEIAAEVGVAKTTLYRRWPSKDHLVVAVVSRWQDALPIPDRGSVEQDLIELTASLAETLDPSPMRRLVAELAAASARDDSLREPVAALWAQRRQASLVIIERAISRAEVRANLDPFLIIDQLAGPLYYRVLITAQPLDRAYATALVHSVLSGAQPTQGD